MAFQKLWGQKTRNVSSLDKCNRFNEGGYFEENCSVSDWHVFALSSNNAHALMDSWNRNTKPDVNQYRVYLSSSYDKASRLEGDIFKEYLSESSGYILADKPCFCCDKDCQVDRDLYWDDHDVVFIAVTAIDWEGNESEPTIGYFLYGNICWDHNDGRPYIEAAVHGVDLAVFATFLAKLKL